MRPAATRLPRKCQTQMSIESPLIGSGSQEEVELRVNTLINAGCYVEALALDHPRPRGDQKWWSLIQLNLAEAEYNLGHWEAALLRIDAIDHPTS